MVLLSSSPQWLPICLGVKTHILTMAYKALRGLPWPSVPPVTGLACAAHPLHSSCSGLFAISHSCQACSLCLNALSTVVYKAPSHAPAGFLLNVALSLSQGDLPLSSTLPALPSGVPLPSPWFVFLYLSDHHVTRSLLLLSSFLYQDDVNSMDAGIFVSFVHCLESRLAPRSCQ